MNRTKTCHSWISRNARIIAEKPKVNIRYGSLGQGLCVKDDVGVGLICLVVATLQSHPLKGGEIQLNDKVQLNDRFHL